MIGPCSIPAWIAVTALLLNGLGHGGLVLCIGDDGHLAVEAACVESPLEISCCEPDHENPEATLVQENRCGQCTDLPLLINPVRARKATAMEGPPAAAVAPVPLPCVRFGHRAEPAVTGRAGPGDAEPPGSLRALNTIVLRL